MASLPFFNQQQDVSGRNFQLLCLIEGDRSLLVLSQTDHICSIEP